MINIQSFRVKCFPCLLSFHRTIDFNTLNAKISLFVLQASITVQHCSSYVFNIYAKIKPSKRNNYCNNKAWAAHNNNLRGFQFKIQASDKLIDTFPLIVLYYVQIGIYFIC